MNLNTYMDDDFERVAEAIGKTTEEVSRYRERFEEAALWYRLDMRSPKRMAPSAARDKLKRMAAAGRKLLYHLGIRSPRDAPDGPGNFTIFDALSSVEGQSEEKITRATAKLGRLVEILESKKAIEELERTAELAAKDVTALGDLIVPKEHRGDEATNDWLKSMLEIYKELTGKEPGTSVNPTGPNRGDVGGPFIRFVQAAGYPIGMECSSKAWRRRIRNALEATS
jgi:hypothetical protein